MGVRKRKAPAQTPEARTPDPVELILEARSEAAVLTALAQATWMQADRQGLCPADRTPTVEQLATWLYSGVDADLIQNAQQECGAYLNELFADKEADGGRRVWSWVGVEVAGFRKGREEPQVRLMLTGSMRGGVPAIIQDGVMQAHRRWLEYRNRLGDKAPKHPLAPLVRIWQRRRRKTTPEERRRGIMPAAFAALMPYSRAHRAGQLDPPEHPGPVGLTPEEQVGLPVLANVDVEGKGDTPSLLLGLFDKDFNDHGRSPTAPVLVRLVVEIMLATPTGARDGYRHEVGPFSVREITSRWLRWKVGNYRVGGAKTGRALHRAVHGLHNFVIPYGRSGGYFPVRMDHYTGWELSGHLYFDVRLPAGSGVGPPVDREVLRVLGVQGARAYRAYLWLIFQWDRYGGHGGRLITPTRRSVLRNEGGHLVDAKGEVITDEKGHPVRSVHDPRAVVLEGREDNPARVMYPEYDAEGLVEMIYSPSAVDDLRKSPNRWRQAMVRARRSIELVEKVGGCVIERCGRQIGKRGAKTPGYPWRIMPPDRFAINDLTESVRTGRSHQGQLDFY